MRKTTARTASFLLLFWASAWFSAVSAQSGGDLEKAMKLEFEAAQAAQAGKTEMAIEYGRRAMDLYRSLGETKGMAACMLLIGQIEVQRQRFEEALPLLSESLTFYQRLRSEPGMVAINHFHLAEALIGLGRRAEGLAHLEESVQGFRLLQDPNSKAEHLCRAGLLAPSADRLDLAVTFLEESLVPLRSSRSPDALPTCLQGLAEIYKVKGSFDKALPLIEEAVSLSPGAVEYKTLAGIHAGLGNYDRALASIEKAERLYEGSRDASGLWKARTTKASIYYYQGKFEASLALYESIVAAFRSRSDQDNLAAALTSMGVVLNVLGRSEEAQKLHTEALEIRRRQGYRIGEATALNNLATSFVAMKQWEAALELLDQSLSLRREAGDLQGEASGLANSGVIYTELGRIEEAISRFGKASEILRKIGDTAGELMAEMNIAQFLAFYGRAREGLDLCERLLRRSREIGNKRAELAVLQVQGSLLFASGQPDQALAVLAQAQDLRRLLGAREGAVKTSTLMGKILLSQGRKAEAGELLSQSLAAGPDQLDLELLGMLQEASGKRDEAIESYRQALAAYENSLIQVRSEDLLASFTSAKNLVFERLVLLLSQKGEYSEAFKVAEHARARAFLQQTGTPRIDPRGGSNDALIEEEHRVRARLDNLYSQIQKVQKEGSGRRRDGLLNGLQAEADALQKSYELLLIRLKQSHPEYASLVRPEPLPLAAVQKTLDPETTLVAYFMLQDRVFVWIMDSSSSSQTSLTVSQTDLKHRVQLLRSQIASREAAPGQAGELYKDLFAPIVEKIRYGNLVIVPQGFLHELPFAALVDEQGLSLAGRFNLSVLPSASVLPWMMEKRSPNAGRLLAVGDPDNSLPQARKEAEIVAGLYGSEPLLGARATEAALRAQAPGVDMLHIAAHARLDSARPLFSYIQMAGEDRRLDVNEIYGLDLKGTNLVVLSACETALGTLMRGDDLIGFSRAFLYAGASAVLATLWPVDDAATSALMESFYKHLKMIRSPAAALRRAQLEIAEREPWRAPYYWAGFVLSGDAGERANLVPR